MPMPADISAAPVAVDTIKKRADFLRISQRGQKFITQSFIMLMLPEEGSGALRIGYTVTKKMGNAVCRNRIKRRLREAVRQVMPEYGRPGHAYVLIARQAALQCPFEALLRDMRFACERIGRVRPAARKPPATSERS